METIILAGTVFNINGTIHHPDDELDDDMERPYWQGILDLFNFHGITFDYNNHSASSIYDLRMIEHNDDHHDHVIFFRETTPLFGVSNTNGYYSFNPITCQCHHHRHCGCDIDCIILNNNDIHHDIDDDEDEEEICGCECHTEFECTCPVYCHTPMATF